MKKKLYAGIGSMLVMLLLLFIGNQLIVSLFRSSTEKLIVEYHELNALMQYKIGLIRLTNSLEKYSTDNSIYQNNEIQQILREVIHQKDHLHEVITEKHVGTEWKKQLSEFRHNSTLLDSLLKTGTSEIGTIIRETQISISKNQNELDKMINETRNEISEYEKRNRTINLHGTTTLLSVGLLIIIILSTGSIILVRSITKPISILLNATREITHGNSSTRIEKVSHDEFDQLADSFNKMLDNLDRTTVSATYFHGIINNFSGFLIVTDKNCSIRFVNEYTLKILNHNENELLGRNIMAIFNSVDNPSTKISDSSNIENCANAIRERTVIFLNNGSEIPILMTCSLLRDSKSVSDGLVVAGYDLSERQAYEERITRLRREGAIAINEAQEQERMRIATEIHDGLGQQLAAISYALQGLDKTDEKFSEQVSRIILLVNQTIQESKSLAYDLIPIVLKDFGLPVAIESLVERTNNTSSVRIVFSHYNMEKRSDPRLEKAIYRICQESLNNILKHADADVANIQLFGSEEKIVLVIDDDGIGFDFKEKQSSPKQGIGLMSIRERVSSFNGTFTLNSQPGMGTEIIVEIPCM